MNIHSVEYHRNGVGGEGFHVVQFTDRLDGVDRRMVGILFESGIPGQCAVLDIDDLGTRWRGADYYEDELDEAMKYANLTGESFTHRRD